MASTAHLAKRFIMPREVEERFEIDASILAYAVYWDPCGDECVVMRIHKNGWVEGGDSDWLAFLELERLNPIIRQHNLGSSDSEAEEALLVDNMRGRFYIVPIGVWYRLESMATKNVELVKAFLEELARGEPVWARSPVP